MIQWRKSSRSGQDTDCVELAHTDDDDVLMRDSKNAAGPILRFPREAVKTLTATL